MACRLKKLMEEIIKTLRALADAFGLAKHPIISSVIFAIFAGLFCYQILTHAAPDKPNQTANDSNCSNTSITAGGSVTNNCTSSPQPNSDPKK